MKKIFYVLTLAALSGSVMATGHGEAGTQKPHGYGMEAICVVGSRHKSFEFDVYKDAVKDSSSGAVMKTSLDLSSPAGVGDDFDMKYKGKDISCQVFKVWGVE